MTKKMTRRSFLKKASASLLALAGAGIGSRFYAERIEPYWVDIINHTITDSHIPNRFSGTTLVQFSDTHLGFQYQLKDLQKTITAINGLAPDIVVFTGDLVDKPDHYESAGRLIPLLREIRAPLGKFCVFGNHDHGGNGTSLYQKTMEDSGFTVLRNANAVITNADEESIYIAGIDEPMLGTVNWEDSTASIPKEAYSILLSHAPDLADRAKDEGFSLQLSGHSHGGQIRIPFIGALITPPFAKKYSEGMYQLTDMQLYVNRGLGTTRMPLRFLARPEITVFTLQST